MAASEIDKVKILQDSDPHFLEQKIQNFIPGRIIEDIQYSSAWVGGGYSGNMKYSALIRYQDTYLSIGE